MTPLTAGSSQTRSLASATQELAATPFLPSERGKDPFLKQTDAHRKCRIASLEDCQARSFLETVQEIVQERCGCVPWALAAALQTKVL